MAAEFSENNNFHVIFHNIEHKLQENIIAVFYKLFVKLRCIFNPLKIIYRQFLEYFVPKKIIYIPVLKIR